MFCSYTWPTDSWLRSALLTKAKDELEIKNKTEQSKFDYFSSLRCKKRDTHPRNCEKYLSMTFEPKKSSKQQFCSPIRSLTPGSKMFAFECMRRQNFHIPTFRQDREDRETTSIVSPRSVDFEIEAYFDYLRLFCAEQRHDIISKDHRRSASTASKLYSDPACETGCKIFADQKFKETCQLINESLQDIENLPASKRPAISLLPHTNNTSGIEPIASTSAELCQYESSVIRSNRSSILKRVCSLPQISEHSNECSTIVEDIMQSSRSAENLFENHPSAIADNFHNGSSSGTCSESLDLSFSSRYNNTNSQLSRLRVCVSLFNIIAGYVIFPFSPSKILDLQTKTNPFTTTAAVAATKANLVSLENQAPSFNEFEELARIEKELVLESERRKKYERELDDQRSRRHGYVPCQIKTPLIGDSRFEKLINDYNKPSTTSVTATTTSMSPTPVEFRGVARALYAFTAHAPKELSFFKGDLIKVKNLIDENWYEGELNGIVGLVPANHVELLATAGGDERVVVTEVSKTREGQGQVLYNFDGRGINELPLCKNEYITLIRKVDNNWYEGRNDMGRKGIFPSNYIRVMQEPSSDLKDYVSALSLPYQGYQQPGTEFKIQVNGVQYGRREPGTGSGESKFGSSGYGNYVGGPSSSSYEIPVRRPKSPLNYQPSYDSGFRSLALSQPSSRFTDQLDKFGSFTPFGSKSGVETTSATPGGQSSSYEESYERKLPDGSTSYTYKKTDYNTQTTYETIFPYHPLNSDELELIEGDIVYVEDKCDDGWYIGTCLRTGKFGTFPGNYKHKKT
uniref:SH3 domain-containing protein n=1 Tax=Romanomermis culicivorax TaxID=13658 RepID=A0A915IG64_ROMCU